MDGSGNVSIATSTNHTHSYLPLSGGTITSSSNTPITLMSTNSIVESSIIYKHNSSTYAWCVGLGAGTHSIDYFSIYYSGYGTTFWSKSNGDACVSKNLTVNDILYVGSNASIFTDSEGGNINLKSPNGYEFQMDTVDDNFRLYRWKSNVYNEILKTDSNCHIYNFGSKVICARNFTLSGNTLYITTT